MSNRFTPSRFAKQSLLGAIFGTAAAALSGQSSGFTITNPVFCRTPTAGLEVNYAAELQDALNSCKSGETLMLPAMTDTLKFINCGGATIRIPSNVNLGSYGSILHNAVIKFSPAVRQLKNTRIFDMEMKRCEIFIEEDQYDGTSTGSNTSNTFNDTNANWTVDSRLWWYVRIVSGTGSGQTKRIIANTATRLTTSSAWTTVPDETSVYYLYCNLSSITIDNVFMDGTDINDSGASPRSAIVIGNFGFNVKVINGTQICNYAKWGIAQYGNSDHEANTGTAYLGTGVYVCLNDLEIVNCGGAGDGGAILLRGGAKDGSTLHMNNVLMDGSQHAMYIDDSVSNVTTTPSSGSGGLTIMGSNIRVERCGKVGTGPETSSIVNIRGNVTINGLWIGTAMSTAFQKNIWNRAGKFVAQGGRSTTPAQIYDIYSEPNVVADFDVEMSNPYTIGALKMLKANANNECELESIRIRIRRTSATTVKFTFLGGNGWGWGVGGGAGDRWNNTESVDASLQIIPPAVKPASVSVGSGFSQVYSEAGTGGGTFTFTLAHKQIAKVLGASIQRMDAGLTNIFVDGLLLNGVANFSLYFTDNTGVEKNIVSLMADNKYIDVAVMVAISR